MRVTKSIITNISNNPKSILSYKKTEIEDIFKHLENKYYNTDTPLVSDSIYDLLRDIVKEEYKDIETNVGALPEKKKVKLPYWMGSMDKITKQASLERFKNKFKGNYVISDKLDGVSALLIVSKTKKEMFTRGNGVYGQDISNIIKHIKNLKNIKPTKEPFAIRGELIIKKENFQKISHMGANARNMVSGIANSKTFNEDIIKYVDFIGYTLIEPAMKPSLQYNFMKSVGVEGVYQKPNVIDISEEKLSSILIERRTNSPYEIDGIIVTHDEIYGLENGKNPSHSFAFKNISLLDTKETSVIDIEWNISKDGYIKPIVLLSPIRLSGVIIKKATGFNAGFIKENNIGPGSIVTITRSGDVIPYIKNVVSSTSAKLPNDIEYKWNDTGKEIIVMGSTNEQNIKILEHFYTKIKVKWLSAGTLKKLYDAGYTKPYDIYNISEIELSKIIGSVMAKKIVLEREQTFKDVKCHVLMDASNSFGRGFGEKRMELITKTIPSIENGYIPSLSELISIEGISDITGNQFIKGLYEYQKFIKVNPFHCISRSATTITESKKINSEIFLNKVVLFTGFRSEDLEKFVKENNGKVASTFTKAVNILVIKDSNVENKKTDQAHKDKIPIYTKDEFVEKFMKNN